MSAGSTSRRVGRLALGVLAAGLIVTAVLTVTALALYDRNESRLLDLRVRQLGLVLGSVVPSIQTPLASGAALAEATNGNPRQLRLLLAPEVGPGRQFASISLWPLGGSRLVPIAVFGKAPLLASDPALAAAFFARVGHARILSVTGLLRSGRELRLGYGFGTPNVKRGFALYAESVLPASRHSRLSANSAFADLNYVLYLGRTQSPATLLVTNLAHLPPSGRKASVRVPFGDSDFTLVVTARGSLGGQFFRWLPWVIAVIGGALALAAALLTDRLVRRRQRAEELAERLDRIAAENQQLYAEQRTIADTLQHALLPEALPQIAGLETAARYVPGAAGVEIGGDWYDLIVQREGRTLVVVGDVAGRGVAAATTMASLRFAVLAYAADGAGPAEVLAKLARFAATNGHGYFATVLCAQIDVAEHAVTLASAGHLAPLLVARTHTDYLPLRVGVPIGAGGDGAYEQVTVPLPDSATLIAFTDGLVERRNEALDDGLARLRETAAARAGSGSLDELLTTLVSELAMDGGYEDDTAVLAVRWTERD